jgi:hypothetical protein
MVFLLLENIIHRGPLSTANPKNMKLNQSAKRIAPAQAEDVTTARCASVAHQREGRRRKK